MNRTVKRFIYIVLVLVLSVAGAASADVYAAKNKKVLPKKITVQGTKKNQAEMQLEVGEKKTTQYSVTPKKATNKKVSFTSSNKKIVKVSAKGVVEGVAEGTATVTIQSKAKKSVKAKIKVTVENEEIQQVSAKVNTYQAAALALAPVGSENIQETVDTYLASSNTASGITLNQTYLEIAAGESFQLTATVVPVTSTAKVTWSINVVGGINVSSTGNIFVTDDTPVGITAVITAKAGNVTATCQVVTVQGACEHAWGAWTTIQQPECMMEGIARSTCGKCGKMREKSVAAAGHSFLGKVVTEPTCDEVGEMEYTCQRCGETKMGITPAKGHTWNVNGEVLQLPTCTTAGKAKYTCSVCGGEKEDVISALGHTWDAGEITNSPTCTARGERTYHCLIDGCNGTKREALDPTGHIWTYGEITTPPTCTADGRRACTCLVCSAKTTGVVAKLGHSYDAGVVTKNPTCTAQGVKTFTCSTCSGTRREYLSPLGHDLEADYRIDAEPTCTKDGKRSKHCKRVVEAPDGTKIACDYVTDISAIQKLGHKYNEKLDENDGIIDDGVVVTTPNCTMPGLKTYTCTRDDCANKKRVVIPALGHDYTKDYVLEVEPTCTKSGKKCQMCQRDGCGKKINISFVPPLGHLKDENNVVQVMPTCTTEGSNSYKCVREIKDANGNAKACGAPIIEVLPALSHKFETTWTQDKAPTCTVAGQKSKHCQNTWTDQSGQLVQCSVIDDVTVIEPNGHNWSGWAQKLAPSHGIAGIEERMCGVCQATQTRAKAAEHTYNSSGTCQGCGQSVSMTNSMIGDWEYTVNEIEGTVLLKKYIGTADCIKIPAQMSVTVDGVTRKYDVKFAGGYQERTKTGVFASNSKCKVRAVSLAEGIKITDMKYMFFGCDNLETVLNIPSTVTDMTGTFKDCTSLISVGPLPSTITELPSTFENCKKLCVAPDIPRTVKSLYATFKNCEMLASAPTLPDGVENLDWTFRGTALSKAPALPSTVTDMTNTFESTPILEVPEDIPAGVKKLTLTFYGCNGLEIVPQMPSTVETMEYTFKNCKNITYAAPLPRTVTRQVDVFAGCDKLEQ